MKKKVAESNYKTVKNDLALKSIKAQAFDEIWKEIDWFNTDPSIIKGELLKICNIVFEAQKKVKEQECKNDNK